MRGFGQGVAALFVVALFVLLVQQLASGRSAQRLAAAVRHGDEPVAPDFDLRRLDADGTLSLASLRGTVVVLNFWASWCVPCKQEAPVLEAAWKRHRGERVVFVGVNAQDLSGDAKRFIDRFDINYPNLRDGPGKVVGRYGVTGFPETWFVDRRGRLVGERVQGPLTATRLERNIEAAGHA